MGLWFKPAKDSEDGEEDDAMEEDEEQLPSQVCAYLYLSLLLCLLLVSVGVSEGKRGCYGRG